ncbi:multiple resistance and pH regulation protein F [Ectothiorhodospiraceae bacterium 2226]|nr:multiple resistance and pH regulation protein F [Ectothiorhodospiraceae bacterium 2226]
MSGIYAGAVVFLLVNIVVGLLRVLRGPTAADRMLAADLFATAAVAIMLLLSVVAAEPALVDVALVFALVSVLAAVTFVSRLWSEQEREKERDDGPAA